MEEYLKLTKGEDVKLIDPKSSLIAVLQENGWKLDGANDESELDALKAKADELGLKYHHKAGVDKLKELIDAHEAE